MVVFVKKNVNTEIDRNAWVNAYLSKGVYLRKLASYSDLLENFLSKQNY